jgi:hypothetical protein
MYSTQFVFTLIVVFATALPAADIVVTETDEQIQIRTPLLEAAIRKQGYVSGVAGGSFVDRQTGYRDLGFGLDIVDWIMEPGSDEAWRDQLPEEMVYQTGNLYHGDILKRSLEGPQICTRAMMVDPEVIEGPDFVAVTMNYQYHTAAPGYETGSTWTQWLVFPEDTRYFISMDRVDSVNASPAMFQRIDMPGHLKHDAGDTFSAIYLSYAGVIPSSEFLTDFAPDDRFRYLRNDDESNVPERIIRGYHIRNPETGEDGPWLAGMTLDPSVVSEAWCHQRGYICMIEEYGGRAIERGESFSAAFIVGYFDSIEEMHAVYDAHKGYTGLGVTEDGWELVN